eukprot:Skav221331  [mRNA]  locus=scaffold1234:10388:14883:+ [translate_table: standard]
MPKRSSVVAPQSYGEWNGGSISIAQCQAQPPGRYRKTTAPVDFNDQPTNSTEKLSDFRASDQQIRPQEPALQASVQILDMAAQADHQSAGRVRTLWELGIEGGYFEGCGWVASYPPASRMASLVLVQADPCAAPRIELGGKKPDDVEGLGFSTAADWARTVPRTQNIPVCVRLGA